MFGKGLRFSHFTCDEFSFPSQIYLPHCEIKNERHFIEFVIRNDWVQRRIGIKADRTDGFFPDLRGEIYDGSGDNIRVEVEYKAENYSRHGHVYKGCDLILSFLKKPETVFIKGIPVWSFYECFNRDKYADLCLYNNINYNFSKHPTDTDYEDQIMTRKEKMREGWEIWNSNIFKPTDDET